ncbi:MAG: glycosyltransferase family 39 protein [Leptospira sp.]|nr:glycosyltransferase family 39 protein [Leptospira sp.]
MFPFTLFLLTSFYFFFFFSLVETLPPVWPDEVLFFSPSSQFSNFGILKTDVLIGLIPGMELKTLWMPPGYLLISSLFLKIFPQTLFTIRFVSFLTTLLSAYAFIFLLKRFKFSNISISIAFATILFEPLLFRFGIPGRMEGTTILFFLISLLFATSRLNNIWRSILSGLFLAFSTLSHPFTASLGFVVLYPLLVGNEKKIQSLLLFTIAGLLPFLGWLYYIYPDWELFLIQFGSQLVRKKALFESFDLLTKLKIFSFGFAYSKIRLLIIGFQLILLILFTYQIKKAKLSIPYRFNFFWLWIICVFFSIYSSSEGWYVIHFLFPFAFGMAILSEQKYIGIKLALFGILISVIGWFYIINIHYIKSNSDLILQNHFQKIYESVKNYKKIYVQSIPDPYFYLKSKNPNQQILEFIPGELEIPSEVFKNTIAEQEAFIFYNEDLKNQAIKEFLIQNPEWIREEWDIPVSSNHWLAYKTIIYRKPL